MIWDESMIFEGKLLVMLVLIFLCWFFYNRLIVLNGT